MKEKVLRIFRVHGGSFVSGQEICDALNVSRTAVWKVINALKEEGYEFDAVKNRGYRLVSCPDTLTQWEIASRLDTVIMGCRLEAYFRSHTSTNNVLKKLADEGAPEGTVVVADIQEGGKGRRGREWATPPPGTNIAMSILVRPRIEPGRLSPITLVAAMAVRQAVAGMMDDAADQKDIMIRSFTVKVFTCFFITYRVHIHGPGTVHKHRDGPVALEHIINRVIDRHFDGSILKYPIVKAFLPYPEGFDHGFRFKGRPAFDAIV